MNLYSSASNLQLGHSFLPTFHDHNTTTTIVQYCVGFLFNGYHAYYEYPTPTHAPTPAIFIFNETGNGLCGINILEGIFGVGLCKSNNIDKINNGIVNGMFIFIFFKLLFSLFSLSM